MTAPRKSPDYVLDITDSASVTPTEIRRVEAQLPEGSSLDDVDEVRTGRIVVSPEEMECAAAQFARRKKRRKPKKGTSAP